jgi:hypothetical protein
MFDLFKKQVDLLDYVRDELSYVLSEEWEKKVPQLCIDNSNHLLDDVDIHELTVHLQAITIQLLGARLSKSGASLGRLMEAYSLKDELYEKMQKTNVQNMAAEYNKAFGSSPIDGVAEMARLATASLVTDSANKEPANKYLHKSMYSILRNMYAATSKVKLR